jgi:hypothetical protein
LKISADVKIIILVYAKKTREGMNDISFQFNARVGVGEWQTVIPFRARDVNISKQLTYTNFAVNATITRIY